jgi:hypothetical protein
MGQWGNGQWGNGQWAMGHGMGNGKTQRPITLPIAHCPLPMMLCNLNPLPRVKDY